MRPGLALGFVLFKSISVIDCSSHRVSCFPVFCMRGLFEGRIIGDYEFGVLGAGYFRVSANVLELWAEMQAGEGKTVHSFGLVLRLVWQDCVARSPGPVVVCPC